MFGAALAPGLGFAGSSLAKTIEHPAHLVDFRLLLVSDMIGRSESSRGDYDVVIRKH
jgi:hypothetical protein